MRVLRASSFIALKFTQLSRYRLVGAVGGKRSATSETSATSVRWSGGEAARLLLLLHWRRRRFLALFQQQHLHNLLHRTPFTARTPTQPRLVSLGYGSQPISFGGARSLWTRRLVPVLSRPKTASSPLKKRSPDHSWLYGTV